MRSGVGEAEDEEESDEESGVLTVGGVVLHKVFGLFGCDHVDVTHLHTHTHVRFRANIHTSITVFSGL